MSKRLMDYDPVTKTATYHDYDHLTGKTHIETVQDCSAILEHNKRMRNNRTVSRFNQKEDYYHFATVPNTVLYEFLTKYGLDWQKAEDLPKIEKLIQSREYKKLLTVDKV